MFLKIIIVDVKTGQPVELMLDALGDDEYLSGTVVAIDPAETVVSGAVYYQTTVDFDQGDQRIRPGMTVNALIRTITHENVLAVPAASIYLKDKNKFVKILQDNKAVEREVRTGIESENGMIEIISGLNEGQRVILGE